MPGRASNGALAGSNPLARLAQEQELGCALILAGPQELTAANKVTRCVPCYGGHQYRMWDAGPRVHTLPGALSLPALVRYLRLDMLSRPRTLPPGFIPPCLPTKAPRPP